ncbi:MAG TPA: glycosyltransferase family 4 protein [Bacteroidetes bacterium]|nr:glycosyltransferase family 4 protein [Bacteroidota bacterium]
MQKPKVALVHDYLLQYGGAEKTLEAIAELFPDAPIYTGAYSPKNFPEAITKRRIIQPKNPMFKLLSKHLSFLMPMVFENFDLNEYDLIISDSASWAKGVLTKPDQLHVSYIHTPPRFLYHYSVESPMRNRWYYKPVINVIDHFLRIWDFCAAQRPDFLIANSMTTQKRIQKFYNRNAKIIHPPTEIGKDIEKSKDVIQKPYFCCLGRLATYKNFDYLISAFNLLGWKLLVMGTGPEEKNLKKMAKGNIKFLGKVSEEEKYKVLANTKGLINPVIDEDWGIVPLEAMSVGIPVLAHKSGGATENVKNGVTGMFFTSIELESFIEAIKTFSEAVEKGTYNKERMINFAKNFTKEKFQEEFSAFVKEKWEEHARVS